MLKVQPYSFFTLLTTLLCSCVGMIRPTGHFSEFTPPPAPDYSKEESWAALPGKKDAADEVPENSGLTDGQKEAKVDVFFIHPTSFFRKINWNADVGDQALNKQTDHGTIRQQASVYNGSAKVYAPRYRQATLYSFIAKDTSDGNSALDLAYSDVRKAFIYYMDHFNQGRPVIIASHSQGTRHAGKLLLEFFEQDTAMRKKLVAAYIIGSDIHKKDYQNLKPCNSPDENGCIILWNAVAWGKRAPRYDSACFCVNPLTWKSDTSYASAKLNKGSVSRTFNRIDKELCDAKCNYGQLWIHPPKRGGYPALGSSYHLMDYGLFYLNIRENVKLRTESYFNR